LPEDDFDAFYNAVHSTFCATIRVTITGNDVVKDARKDKVTFINFIFVAYRIKHTLAFGNTCPKEAEIGCTTNIG
jgi:hypothetical protein